MEVLERDRELAVLEACLGRARRGRGQLVWVRGEAGIGKTTLVDRFTERLRGARLVRGTCDPLVTPRAFGPLLDIYDRLGLGDGGDVEPTRDAVFRRLRDELLSEAWVTVAVIEDVHWADEATFDLLRFLGRRVVADAARVVADRASSWEPAARQKGVSIVAASAATVLPVQVVEGALEQMLDNFISNALRAAPPGSSIEVGANTNGEHVVCRVADRGPGLSTVDRERAFERFWRARSAADGGSGLGLAIITRLAELSDAHVALHERDGGGLIAEVALRRAHSH